MTPLPTIMTSRHICICRVVAFAYWLKEWNTSIDSIPTENRSTFFLNWLIPAYIFWLTPLLISVNRVDGLDNEKHTLTDTCAYTFSSQSNGTSKMGQQSRLLPSFVKQQFALSQLFCFAKFNDAVQYLLNSISFQIKRSRLSFHPKIE